jgi:hypothetical protein
MCVNSGAQLFDFEAPSKTDTKTDTKAIKKDTVG